MYKKNKDLSKYIITILFIGSLLIIMTSIINPNTLQKKKPYILVTTSILADIIQNIVQDKGTVEAIIPYYTNPHEARPSLRTFHKLDNAQILVKNGCHLEGGYDANLQQYKNTSPEIFTASDTLPPKSIIRHNGYEDPHFWLDPALIIIFITAFTNKIIEINPADKAYYLKNLKAYIKKLKKITQELEKTIKKIPSNKQVIVTHNSLSYLTKYGLHILPIIPGTSTVGEPSIYNIKIALQKIIQNNISTLYKEMSTQDKYLENLRIEADKQYHKKLTIEMLYTDAIPQDCSYIHMIEHNNKQFSKLIPCNLTKQL